MAGLRGGRRRATGDPTAAAGREAKRSHRAAAVWRLRAAIASTAPKTCFLRAISIVEIARSQLMSIQPLSLKLDFLFMWGSRVIVPALICGAEGARALRCRHQSGTEEGCRGLSTSHRIAVHAGARGAERCRGTCRWFELRLMMVRRCSPSMGCDVIDARNVTARALHYLLLLCRLRCSGTALRYGTQVGATQLLR